MNILGFLFTASGSKILLAIIGILIVLGFILQSQCNFISQTNIAKQYADELTKQKQRAWDDKERTLREKLQEEPIVQPKKPNVFKNIFRKKQKDIPPELQKIKDKLNMLGEKSGALGEESNKK